MRKFKKVIASIVAAASVMSCMAVSASADTVSIRRGQAGSQANILGARQVYYEAYCSSSSTDYAIFRLGYSSGSSLITIKRLYLDPGESYKNTTDVYDTGKMWTYQVLAPNNDLNTIANGLIEARLY